MIVELALAALGGWIVGMTVCAVLADRRHRELQKRYDALRYRVGSRAE